MSRPEHIAPPELFYNASESGKYTSNSRIITIQAAMAERCIELLNLPAAAERLILDIGCGSGLSGDALAAAGHAWVGLDVSADMLGVAHERGCGAGGSAGGDLLLADMGQGFGFRAGMFDGAISVSALQWLCYSDKADHRAGKRLEAFFTSLYRCLRRGARAALQFYPEGEAQLELITAAAHRCGFSGGLVVDNPQSKRAKKFYLCIFAGSDSAAAPARLGAEEEAAAAAGGGAGDAEEEEEGEEGEEMGEEDEEGEEGEEEDDEDEEEEEEEGAAGHTGASSSSAAGAAAPGRVPFEARRGTGGAEAAVHKRAERRGAPIKVESRAWVLAKKSAQRRRGGKEVRPDTKYSGRKRGIKF